MIGAAETPAAEVTESPPQHAPPPERTSLRPNAPRPSAPVVPALMAEPKPDALPVPPDAPPAPAAPRAAATAVGVSAEAAAVWSKVVQVCVQHHPLLRALVTNSMLVSLEGEKALLSCAERFALSAPKWREKLSEVFTRERGATTAVEFEVPGAPPESAGTEGGGEAGAASDSTAQSAGAQASTGAAASFTRPAMPGPGAVEHPLVKQAIELFGARVVDVQPPLRRP